MKGHVRQRGKGWAYVVDVGRDPQTGKRRQSWRSGFRTRKDAERALREALTALDTNSFVERSKLTLGAYLTDEWLPARASQLRPSTLAGYRDIIRTHVVPRIGGRRLQDVTPAMLNSLYAALLSEPRRAGRPLSATTVRGVAAVLRRALSDAVRWGLIVRNPAELADPPASRDRTHRGRTWSPDELSRFLDHVSGDPLYALYLTAATTGARRGELLGLTWGRLDLDAATLHVAETVVMVAGTAVASTPKTKRSNRTIALDAETVRVLRELRRAQVERRLLLGSAYSGDLVFCHGDGSPIRPDGVGRRFERLAAAAGVPVIRFHDLRHTHATLAFRAGVHPKVVSERLGHASVAFTLDVYSASIPAMQSDAAEAVASLIAGAR